MIDSKQIGTWLLCVGVAACSGNVEVGDAKAMPNAGGGGSGGTDSTNDGAITAPTQPTTPPTDCTAAFAARRQPYLAWQTLANDFGSVAPGVFTGNLSGGDELTLTIDADQSASLVVGAAAPAPQRDDGYLCGGAHPVSSLQLDFCPSLSSTLLSGATYPIRGATFDSGRLQIPLAGEAAYDAWCALQPPVQQDECSYGIVSLDGFSWGENGCFLGSRRVDCGWLQLAEDTNPCVCTPDGCTGSLGPGPSTQLLDLRYDATDDKLAGSMVFANGDTPSVQFARSAP